MNAVYACINGAVAGLIGAGAYPQLPVTSVVIPWATKWRRNSAWSRKRQDEVAVRVDVDEAGRDDGAADIDDVICLSLGKIADARDPTAR